MFYVGTSGWQYDSWKGPFYPEDLRKDLWLPYFSARYATVEVNNSFYRLPTDAAFERWRRMSADPFVIAVKASRFITHLKRLRDPEEPLALFWSRARLLGPKLGPVLFQLPPRFKADLPRLRDFLAALPDPIVPAFEFRDPTWDTDEVFGALDERGAALVWPDRPGLRPPLVVTGGWLYVRFHQGAPAHPAYPPDALETWADRLAEHAHRDVYVYFNNDPLCAAPRDAEVLRALLLERGCAVAAPAGEQTAA